TRTPSESSEGPVSQSRSFPFLALEVPVRFIRDIIQMLVIAWRIDARLTLFYYASAIVAALAPLAAGITLSLLIDHVVESSAARVTVPLVVVLVVGAHFAIVAVNAAVRFGLHEQYYDYLFRYRLQDWFSYRYCEKLAELDIPHLEDPAVQVLLGKVRDTHAWRVPDFFRMLSYALIAVVGVVSAAVALVSFGWWIGPGRI